MKTVLITGANKSIGFEAARQLLQQGYFVYLGSRDQQRGEQAVSQLQKEGLTNVELLLLDVNNEASVRAARQKVKSLDVLINNAGVLGTPDAQLPSDTSISIFKEVFDTNVFGVISVTQAFLDLLKQSSAPRIVNVTSGLGSLTLQSDPAYRYYVVKPAAYVASKAALNMYTIVLAYELRDTAFKVSSVDPGYTATEFNGFSGHGTIQDAGARLVKAATLPQEAPSGQFYSDDNAPETGVSPW
jgi:NAD(P)-dependent dehydrogenase (short-subunit alcohol dehydrogenase family)